MIRRLDVFGDWGISLVVMMTDINDAENSEERNCDNDGADATCSGSIPDPLW